MSRPAHPPLDDLLAWWLRETDAEDTEAIDLHLLGCDECGSIVDDMAALRAATRAVLEAGQLHAFVGAGFVERMRARGKRVREYRVAPDGGVSCTVAPDDDLVVARLTLPQQVSARRIDAVLRDESASGDVQAERRIPDVPFDPGRHELLTVPRLDRLRLAPAHREVISLFAVGDDGERLIARYAFDHRPWDGAA